MNFSLLQKLLWQAVRYFEAMTTFNVDVQSANQIAKGLCTRGEQPFFEKLHFRAKYLDEDQALQQSLARIASNTPKVAALVVLLAIVFGALATSSYIHNSHNHSINFYAICMAFLGANAITLLLWLVLLPFTFNLAPSGWLLQLWLQLSAHFANAHQPPYFSAASRAYSEFLLSRYGRWQLFTLAHMLWASFFAGAIIALIYYFIVAGYKFNWSSTLLSDTSLQQLANIISYLPLQLAALLGTNSLDNLRFDATIESIAPRRIALLLLYIFAVYGLLLRLVLAVSCALIAKWQTRRYLPNTDCDYYQNLALALDNSQRDSAILDADNPELHQGSTATNISASSSSYQQASHSLFTANITLNDWLRQQPRWQLVAMDMPKLPAAWEQLDWQNADDLGLVANRGALGKSLQQATGASKLLLVLRLASLPDRGIERQIMAFANAVGKIGICLIFAPEYASLLTQWLEFAKRKQLAPLLLVNNDFKLMELSTND